MSITGHEACFVCRSPSWFEELPVEEGGAVSVKMNFASQHEGWQGIPHGGVAMTALLDLADYAGQCKTGANLTYPLAVAWRFGDSVRIGERMMLKAWLKEVGRYDLSMRRLNAEKIYLQAELKTKEPVFTVDFELPPVDSLFDPEAVHQPLEVYDNCFVCGRKRRWPGLERRFFRSATGIDPAVVMVRFGDQRDRDKGLAVNFQQAEGRLHPGVLAALLDELCGWSGVLAGDLYGFTVRFQLKINFLPEIGDELFGISPEPRVRGRGERLLYYPRGVIYRRTEAGFTEVVAVAEGQWLAREELRRQFIATSIKEDLSGIIF
jgi:acyl-coenzyme A thioesterase PaaI-like protein